MSSYFIASHEGIKPEDLTVIGVHMCGSPPPPLLQLLLFIACWRQVGGTIQQYAPLPPPVAVLPLERQSSTNGAVLLTVLTATRPDRQTAEPRPPMIAPVAIVMLLALVLDVQGHGSLIYPLPRGGVDRDLAPFSNGGWPQGHYTCTCVNGTADKCHPAQSCLWFNQVRCMSSSNVRPA